MAAEQTQKPSFSEVIQQASPFTQGKVLDTLVGPNTGDTLLTPDSVEKAGDTEGLSQAEQGLRDYATTLNEGDPADQSRLQIVDRRLNELAFIGLAVAQQTGETDRSLKIQEIQEKLHGYNPGMYKAALRKKIDLLEATPVDDSVKIARAMVLDELSELLDNIDPSIEEVELIRPSQKTLDVIKKWIDDQFEDIFDEIDALEGDMLDAYQMQNIMTMAIETTPAIRDNGWRAEVIQREKSAITVYASDRLIVIPEQRKVTKTAAKNLVVHEVFGHALRSAMAEINSNEVGITGTATYGLIEESLMIALEQCRMGKYDAGRGIDSYITIGLAETSGLSREDISRLTRSMKQITLSGNGITPEVVSKADKLTANQLRRTFAGLVDVDEGIANRTDTKYLHGLNGAWKLLNAIVEAGQVDEGMLWLLQAKFNPYDVLDQQLVGQHSTIPSSIKEALGA